MVEKFKREKAKKREREDDEDGEGAELDYKTLKKELKEERTGRKVKEKSTAGAFDDLD